MKFYQGYLWEEIAHKELVGTMKDFSIKVFLKDTPGSSLVPWKIVCVKYTIMQLEIQSHDPFKNKLAPTLGLIQTKSYIYIG